MLYDPKWNAKKRKTKSLPQIYTAAADAIQKHGHSIGLLRDRSGRMCIWGAVSFAVSGNALDASSNGSHRMLDPLHEFTKGEGVIGWNNTPGRTKRQVVSLLRRAARVMTQRE